MRTELGIALRRAGASLCCVAIALGASTAAAGPAVSLETNQEGESRSSPTSRDMEPYGSLGRDSAPRGLAVSVTEAVVPYVGQTTMSFTRLVADAGLELGGPADAALGLRLRLAGVVNSALAEGRHLGALGNLQFEGWLSFVGYFAGTRWVHGFYVGGAVNLGEWTGNETRSVFQLPAETLATTAIYIGYGLLIQGTFFDFRADLSFGYNDEAPTLDELFSPSQASVSLHFKPTAGLAISVGGIVPILEVADAKGVSITTGIHWRPGESTGADLPGLAGLEIGLGTNTPLEALAHPEIIFPIEPMLELRYRF